MGKTLRGPASLRSVTCHGQRWCALSRRARSCGATGSARSSSAGHSRGTRVPPRGPALPGVRDAGRADPRRGTLHQHLPPLPARPLISHESWVPRGRASAGATVQRARCPLVLPSSCSVRAARVTGSEASAPLALDSVPLPLASGPSQMISASRVAIGIGCLLLGELGERASACSSWAAAAGPTNHSRVRPAIVQLRCGWCRAHVPLQRGDCPLSYSVRRNHRERSSAGRLGGASRRR